MQNTLELKTRKHLKEIINGKNLNKVLWDYNFQTSQGPASTEYLVKEERLLQEAVDYVKEMDDTFHCEYYNWDGEIREYYLSGKDEEFNDDTVGMDEDKLLEMLDEYIDAEGWVFYAFQNLVAMAVSDVMNEIKYEQFDTDYDKFKSALQNIDDLYTNGDLYVDDNILYDDYGSSSINGLHVYTPADYDSTSELEFYIEWTEDTLWSYYECKTSTDFNNIDEVVSYIKANIKK